LIQAQAEGFGSTRIGFSILGEQGDLPLIAPRLIEDGDGFLPGQTLRIVDLTQVEHMSLGNPPVGVATTLDDRPGAMRFAVLASGTALGEHDPTFAVWRILREGVGRHYSANRTSRIQKHAESLGF
jgi:hypothetical protein